VKPFDDINDFYDPLPRTGHSDDDACKITGTTQIEQEQSAYEAEAILRQAEADGVMIIELPKGDEVTEQSTEKPFETTEAAEVDTQRDSDKQTTPPSDSPAALKKEEPNSEAERKPQLSAPATEEAKAQAEETPELSASPVVEEPMETPPPFSPSGNDKPEDEAKAQAEESPELFASPVVEEHTETPLPISLSGNDKPEDEAVDETPSPDNEEIDGKQQAVEAEQKEVPVVELTVEMKRALETVENRDTKDREELDNLLEMGRKLSEDTKRKATDLDAPDPEPPVTPSAETPDTPESSIWPDTPFKIPKRKVEEFPAGTIVSRTNEEDGDAGVPHQLPNTPTKATQAAVDHFFEEKGPAAADSSQVSLNILEDTDILEEKLLEANNADSESDTK
jgi:hypothetical protein